MFGVQTIDWTIIAVYLVGITVIGVWAAKRVKSAASFFIGDRKFGKWMMLFFMFGTGTHSDQAVGVAAKTYGSGVSGIWYEWLYLFVTPFYWVIAPIFRRMRAVTTADYFEMRYGRSVSMLFVVVGLLQLTFFIGMMLKGTSAMVTAVSGGMIDDRVAIVAMTVMFVLYGVAGGMAAAIVTDLVQGLLTVVLSFLVLPFAWSAAGGMSGLREHISDPGMLKLFAPGEIGGFYVAVISFNALIGWVTQPHTMANCGAGRTEMEGRIGTTFGMLLKRVCIVAWMLTGLFGIAVLAGEPVEHVDQVYGLMAHKLLPKIGPGLVGLFIAGMLASVMSSCDAFMVTSAGLFTENFYRKYLVKDRPDRHYVLVGRVTSLLVVAGGIMFAMTSESILDMIEAFWKIAAMMGIVFWVGLFWRRATVAGAWAGTLVSFAAWLVTGKLAFGEVVLWDFNAHFANKLPAFMVWGGKLYLPWQMIIYLSAGFLATVVVSLLTKRVPAERLDRLYACLRTPIGEDEPETAPFTLPPGVEAGPRRSLISHPDFEIPRPSVVGMAGFFGSWVVVAALIGVVYWLVSL
ncbi:MAG TPA: sodium:solute symporter family protein [Anaerohalosphaeraceae bacterium]|jgi:SSS family transporter|nr:sodium:solute symporter family protein [Anaerohalosphaeraceae bacterium]HRT49051.1 sodium:solute symporter family protein [Anaerohalosphaeraceae bacterium]HRT85696.1 sodium:solute symporter family protein [Anaerohalosphaeraceae bacterium]